MDDSTLLKLSILVAMIGLVGLFLYGNGNKTAYSVADMHGFVGQKVLLNGTVSSVSTSKAGNTFFMLSDGTGQINAVIFKNSGIDTAILDNGQAAEVEGKVAEYEGSLEIIASAIKILSKGEENK